MKITTLLQHQLPILALGAAGTATAAPEQKPNIVIILADDMGYGDVACNNPYARTITPAIDNLAASGLRFTDAHSAGSLSGPSRYGLVTGRYFFRLENHNEYFGYLAPDIELERPTIGSMMQRAGYTTGCIGKWHLGLEWKVKDNQKPQILTPKVLGYTNTDFSARVEHTPNDVGFDYSFILPASLDMPPYVFVKNHQVTDPNVMLTTDAYPTDKGPNTEYAWDRIYTNERDVYWERGAWWRNGEMSRSFKFEECLPTIVNEGVEFIQRASKDDKPFFLYLPLTGPHTPWLPSEENKGATELGTYGDFIRDIDNAVARICQTLKDLDIDENTIVIFASDNGAPWNDTDIQKYAHSSNWSSRGQKGDVWDGGHHIPLIIRWPDVISKGNVCHQTVGLIDLFATLADINAEPLRPNEAEDSFSFKPLLYGKTNTPTREHILYFAGDHTLAIKQGDWKYIEGLGSGGFTAPNRVTPTANGPKAQLYNIKSDPLEQNNLYLQETKRAEKMSRKLQELKAQGHSRKL